MSAHRVRDLKFSATDKADQTMELDLGAMPIMKSPTANSDDATVVLDLSATQIHNLLDAESAAQKESPSRKAKP